jgi:hypothetical protein
MHCYEPYTVDQAVKTFNLFRSIVVQIPIGTLATLSCVVFLSPSSSRDSVTVCVMAAHVLTRHVTRHSVTKCHSCCVPELPTVQVRRDRPRHGAIRGPCLRRTSLSPRSGLDTVCNTRRLRWTGLGTLGQTSADSPTLPNSNTKYSMKFIPEEALETFGKDVHCW